MQKVIIDFGANKGQNLRYYLSKSDIVVCVEANPKLTNAIKEEFSASIQNKKLFIENVAVTTETTIEKFIDFYIHKGNDVLSTLVKPKNENDFISVKIKSKSIITILKKYITKETLFYYAKFDLEGYDALVINSMFEGGFFPINISTEVHSVDSLDSIINSKKYSGFKLQEGSKVSKYLSLPVTTTNGTQTMKFIAHSAGPMGEDMPGPWLTEKSIKNKIKIEGFGWKDIHATMTPNNNPAKNKKSDLFLAGMRRFFKVIYQFIIPFKVRDNLIFKKITKKVQFY